MSLLVGAVYLISRVRLFVTPWTVAQQVPLSMEFSRQEDWRGMPFPSPGDRPNPGIKPRYPALQADSLPLSLQGRSLCPFTLLQMALFHSFLQLSGIPLYIYSHIYFIHSSVNRHLVFIECASAECCFCILATMNIRIIVWARVASLSPQ